MFFYCDWRSLCGKLEWLILACIMVHMLTDTLNSFPKGAIYKVFGGPNQHYGHYDLLCGRTVRCLTLPLWHSFKMRVISQICKFLIKKLISVLFVGQAKEEVFPELLNFLEKCDAVKSSRKQSVAMVAKPGQWDFSFSFLLDNWKDTPACGFSRWPLLSSPSTGKHSEHSKC